MFLKFVMWALLPPLVSAWRPFRNNLILITSHVRRVHSFDLSAYRKHQLLTLHCYWFGMCQGLPLLPAHKCFQPLIYFSPLSNLSVPCLCVCFIFVIFNVGRSFGGWRNISMVKSAYCFCRDLSCSPKHPSSVPSTFLLAHNSSSRGIRPSDMASTQTHSFYNVLLCTKSSQNWP